MTHEFQEELGAALRCWSQGGKASNCVLGLDVPSNRKTDALVSAAQDGIAQGLRHYYQLECVGPTPQRLQMLLSELLRRAESRAKSKEADHEGDRQTWQQETDEVDERAKAGRG